jgi:tetratricopeptide (TPR) repeat protein
MSSLLDDIKTLYRDARYKDALSLIETAEGGVGFIHPSILVWKSRCLQLAEDFGPHQFSDIEASLKQALAMDEEYIPAVIDLAYFYLNVLDDAGAAKELFERAISLCRDEMTEAVTGLAQCLAEKESKEEALSFLLNATSHTLDQEKIEALKEEIASS